MCSGEAARPHPSQSIGVGFAPICSDHPTAIFIARVRKEEALPALQTFVRKWLAITFPVFGRAFFGGNI
jgi:hypothetical protein